MRIDEQTAKQIEDRIIFNLQLIKNLEAEKAKADEHISEFRNQIIEYMKIGKFKSKDFELAKVTISDDVKYNQIMTVEEIENEIGEDYTERKINRSKLQKEIPTMHDKAFEKQIKGQKLMIKMK